MPPLREGKGQEEVRGADVRVCDPLRQPDASTSVVRMRESVDARQPPPRPLEPVADV